MDSRRRRVAIATLAATALFAAPGAASAQEVTDPASPSEPPPSEPSPEPAPPKHAKLDVRLKGDGDGKVAVAKRAQVIGKLTPWAAGQRVTVSLERGGKTIKRRAVRVRRSKGGDAGTFELKGPRLIKPGRYQAHAVHKRSEELRSASASSRKARIIYPSLGRGSRGPEVKLFNKLLDRQGYVPSRGRAYTSRTARAVRAFRTANRMARSTNATAGIFKRLAAGRGSYKLRHPGAGKHVEVNIARQVMILAKGDKPVRIYHVSTGKPGTPSDRGHFRFYRRQPGFNSIGMYYSVYYNRGEAIHGYHSVPTYPASHGCVRTPIADAYFNYRWVRLGMSIFVY